MAEHTLRVRAAEEADRPWLAEAVAGAWGSDSALSRGRLIEHPSSLPGLIAERDGRRIGFALLRLERGELEVVALQSVEQWQGAGTALLEAVKAEAKRLGARRAWLVTTNDNLDAARFYQRRGWDWVAFHRDAVTESRALKPEISEVGAYGIPLRHELEFEVSV
jgi:N-acetylglutamate synthase-like GNAT family acetyltransferase